MNEAVVLGLLKSNAGEVTERLKAARGHSQVSIQRIILVVLSAGGSDGCLKAFFR